MATIAVECPDCHQNNELDAAFAGQACRCAHCGTLMTVPDKAESQEKTQRLSMGRPDTSAHQATAKTQLTDDMLAALHHLRVRPRTG